MNKITETEGYYYVRNGNEIERWKKSDSKKMDVLHERQQWLVANNMDTDISYDTDTFWNVYHA